MERLIELTEPEMDAIAGGQGVATANVMGSSSGPSDAFVAAGVIVNTTPTSASAFAAGIALGNKSVDFTFSTTAMVS